MIKTHRWKCKDCDEKLFLRVDDDQPLNLIKLVKFEAFVTKHCINKDHEVVHTEKEEKGFKIV